MILYFIESDAADIFELDGVLVYACDDDPMSCVTFLGVDVGDRVIPAAKLIGGNRKWLRRIEQSADDARAEGRLQEEHPAPHWQDAYNARVRAVNERQRADFARTGATSNIAAE